MVTITMEEVRRRKIPKAELERLKRLITMPGGQIDTSDIPDMTNFAGAVRGRFYRPVTQSVTIRLNAPDVETVRQLAKVKGMPYQTYIKGLLHEALVREAKSGFGAGAQSLNSVPSTGCPGCFVTYFLQNVS